MGTPLKNMSKILLSPRILSPLSPKFLSAINQCSAERVKQVAHKTKLWDSDRSNRALTPVKIRISPASEDIFKDVKKHDVLINTPNKQKITEDGIEDETLFNILGKGSFGKVFKAVNRGQTVAMKLVKNAYSDNRERNALHLTHKNIVRTLEVIENDKAIFSLIIMEYLPNCRNLQNIIRDSQLEIEFLKLARDISEGLLFCHLNNVLHLDIKPSNILVYDDICKICDFGSSVTLSESLDRFKHNGTIHYTAPELLLGQKPTEKSDVYSLGVVFWQMKTKQVPYEDIDNIECVIYKVVKCKLRPDLEEPTDMFSNLYQQCWSQNPNDRPNVSKILKMLSKF